MEHGRGSLMFVYTLFVFVQSSFFKIKGGFGTKVEGWELIRNFLEDE